MCPFINAKKEADVTFLTCVCGEYNVLPICTPTLDCNKKRYSAFSTSLSREPPTPANPSTYSGDAHLFNIIFY